MKIDCPALLSTSRTESKRPCHALVYSLPIQVEFWNVFHLFVMGGSIKQVKHMQVSSVWLMFYMMVQLILCQFVSGEWKTKHFYWNTNKSKRRNQMKWTTQ